MKKTQKKSDLESQFVNLYRKAWGTNAGLDSKRIRAMSQRELKTSIKSLKDFIKLPRRL